MVTIAVVGQDGVIAVGMLIAIGYGVRMAVVAGLRFVKVGFVLSALAVCLGLAYFGWRPFFGGSHSTATYFGSTVLVLGLLGGAILAAIDEAFHRITSARDDRPGFPVILPPPDDPR